MTFLINRPLSALFGFSKANIPQKAVRFATGLTLALVAGAFSARSLNAQNMPGKTGQKALVTKVPATKKVILVPPVNPTVLSYQFTPGAVYHFKVAALFDGHFPPFAVGPDSPPVHFKADLSYTATVKKVDAEGATVDFVVADRALYLFTHEMAENEKIDLSRDDIAPLDGLTSLEDIQKALNASAILRPDGTIVRILSTSTVKVPFDVGFDIRKLFLMMLPITFPSKAIKPGDTWPASDGLLGFKPGKTNYTDRLDSVATVGKDRTYLLHQSANATVADKLDKAGNSTAKDEDAYRVLSGKVDLTTETTFVGPTNANNGKPDLAHAANAATSTPGTDKPANGPIKSSNTKKTEAKNNRADAQHQMGQVKSAHIVLNAVINRKRIKINPDQPEIPENDPLDVKARMTVTRDELGAKPAAGENLPNASQNKPK